MGLLSARVEKPSEKKRALAEIEAFPLGREHTSIPASATVASSAWRAHTMRRANRAFPTREKPGKPNSCSTLRRTKRTQAHVYHGAKWKLDSWTEAGSGWAFLAKGGGLLHLADPFQMDCSPPPEQTGLTFCRFYRKAIYLQKVQNQRPAYRAVLFVMHFVGGIKQILSWSLPAGAGGAHTLRLAR